MNVVIPQSATARTCAPAARPLAVAARRVLVVMVQVWRVLMLVLFWIVAVRMGVLTDENWIVRVAVMPIVMSMEDRAGRAGADVDVVDGLKANLGKMPCLRGRFGFELVRRQISERGVLGWPRASTN